MFCQKDLLTNLLFYNIIKYMKKKAIIFMDYNDTFDDVHEGKGQVFLHGLKNLIDFFNGNVEIAVITAASCNMIHNSIVSDLSYTLSLFSSPIKSKFKYLIEDSNMYLTKINANQNPPLFEDCIKISSEHGTKKDGVEGLLQHIDPNKEITTCIFAGDSEKLDLIMIDAEVGNREKYLLLANRRLLKTTHPVVRLSMGLKQQSFEFGKQIYTMLPQDKQSMFIVKTGCKSYGVGRAMEALTGFLKEKERLH